MSVI
jgi:lysosomal alpha-mannosidase